MEAVERCDLCQTSLKGAPFAPDLDRVGIIECPQCGLAITSLRPKPQDINGLYAEDYYAHTLRFSTWRTRARDKLRSYKCGYPAKDPLLPRIFWKIAARTFGKLFLFYLPYAGQGKRLLEIGCGSGETLLWAQKNGWSVHGVELDAPAAENARMRGIENVRSGTVEECNYPSGYFDAILMLQVLEHLPSPSSTLRECRRLLNREGQLFIAVPKFDSVTRCMLGEYWPCLSLPIHFYHFGEPQLEQMLNTCGFAVTERRYPPFIVTALLEGRSFISTVRSEPDPAKKRRMISDCVRGLFQPQRNCTWPDVMLYISEPHAF